MSNWPSWLQRPGNFYNPSSGEYGTDFDAPFRSPVVALWGGTVTQAERTCWNSSCSDTSGGIVTVNANVPGLGQRSTYYMHFDQLSPNLQIGQVVQPGTFLGWSGGQTSGGNWPTSANRSTGPHMEIGFNAPWVTGGGSGNVNPLPYVQQALQGTPVASGTSGVTQATQGILGGSVAAGNTVQQALQIGASQALSTQGILSSIEPYITNFVEIVIVGGVAVVLGYMGFKLLGGDMHIGERVKGAVEKSAKVVAL